jgi:hypothetical protein
MNWGEGQPIPVAGGSLDQLIAVSADELSIVWFDARGSTGTYRLADRSTSDSAFGAPEALAVGDVIALSPDGLRLMALSPDQSAILEFSRGARGDALSAGEEGAFSLLNADAIANGHGFLDCVVSPDDQTLYYNVVTGDPVEYPLRVSRRSGFAPWPVGEPIESCELKGFGSVLRHPTGVSADGLTLFFFDVTRGVARAAFRRTEQGPFVWFTDLGPFAQASPNAACDKLYYGVSEPNLAMLVAPAE